MVEAAIAEASGEGNGSSSILSQKRACCSSISPGDGAKRVGTEDKRLSTTLLDLSILDCPICFEAFTIPIFQCDNGHLACSSCCAKLSDKCPSCASPIGHIRCRAMESVLESILIPCANAKLGCAKNVSYGKVSTHEKECAFSLCSCPVLDCNYTGPYKDLYDHYKFTHRKKWSTGLAYMISNYRQSSFGAKMNISDKIFIIVNDTRSLLFVVQCFREPYGVYVTVRCIAPSAPEVGEFSYQISYKSVDEHTMFYKSPVVKRIREVSFQTPQENSMLLIPLSWLSGDSLEINICIKKKTN
ncbi:hypothetical protein EUTSA_v10027864mg [Eutrema salsugineum]|uniref:RING-type E3 ubiquitin transferase n=1 Tax=Eutrema salsugineum TaxID=72664 RepID=V4LA24_EUTSA|nr:E3 ubiquitin-protein ligase SINA-like 7 [Eutrema salsugineum]ESQ47280.1 hypothetical protein EUTSA_v10027864mg [Eutrema salsugineum]